MIPPFQQSSGSTVTFRTVRSLASANGSLSCAGGGSSTGTDGGDTVDLKPGDAVIVAATLQPAVSITTHTLTLACLLFLDRMKFYIFAISSPYISHNNNNNNNNNNKYLALSCR